MPFVTSNVKLESAGSLWRLVGNWSGAVGDATGTVGVGGRVWDVNFGIQDAQSQEDRPVPTSISQNTTTGVSTVSVYNKSAVTTGNFSITYR